MPEQAGQGGNEDGVPAFAREQEFAGSAAGGSIRTFTSTASCLKTRTSGSAGQTAAPASHANEQTARSVAPRERRGRLWVESNFLNFIAP